MFKDTIIYHLISCQATYIDNQSIQHQCILRFNYENNNIETVWEKLRCIYHT